MGTPRHYGSRKWHDGPGGHGVCKSCGEPIRWLLATNGKLIPADAKGVTSDDQWFDHARHTAHINSCRQADLWHKPWVPKQSPGESGASGIS